MKLNTEFLKIWMLWIIWFYSYVLIL